jgi:hypothetical protein
MSLHFLFRILFHLSPLVPLLYGKLNLVFAAMFLVALFYIKCLKFTKQIENLEGLGPRADEEVLALKSLRSKWQYLTFLR